MGEMAAGGKAELREALGFLRGRLAGELMARLGRRRFAARLLDYLRARRLPKLLFSPEHLPAIARRGVELDPEEAAWERRIADEALAGRLNAASNPHCDRFLAVDREAFDFRELDHFDPEAIHGLNRMRWLVCLARCYWLTGNRGYFDAMLREWDFFVSRVPFPDVAAIPPGRPFHALDTFIRLTNWYWAYWLALPAPEMTPERNAILLARCLRHFDLVAAQGLGVQEHNKAAMHLESLYLWAAALPEVTGMAVWRESARANLEAAISRAVWPDGVQWEKSAGYHLGCIRWYATSFLLGRRNGEKWSDAYAGRLRRMAEFGDAIVTPDGGTSLLSDSDRTESCTWRAALALARAAFPDMTFRQPVGPSWFSLWASDGLEWDAAASVAAKPRLSVFPYAGVGVARSAQGRHGAMLLLDNGPTRAGHAHKHNLTVAFDALGFPLVVDPGRWIYARNDPARQWVTQGHSHNTIYPEDQPLPLGAAGATGPLPVYFDADPRLGRVEAEERDGFALLRTSLSGFVAEPFARVTRLAAVSMVDDEHPWLLVADRIECAKEHVWTNSWLLPTAQRVAATDGGHVAALACGVALAIATAVSGATPVRDDEAFWCPDYAVKRPARWLRFSARCTDAVRVFLFAPARGEAVVPRVSVSEEAVGLEGAFGSVTVPLAWGGVVE